MKTVENAFYMGLTAISTMLWRSRKWDELLWNKKASRLRFEGSFVFISTSSISVFCYKKLIFDLQGHLPGHCKLKPAEITLLYLIRLVRPYWITSVPSRLIKMVKVGESIFGENKKPWICQSKWLLSFCTIHLKYANKSFFTFLTHMWRTKKFVTHL